MAWLRRWAYPIRQVGQVEVRDLPPGALALMAGVARLHLPYQLQGESIWEADPGGRPVHARAYAAARAQPISGGMGPLDVHPDISESARAGRQDTRGGCYLPAASVDSVTVGGRFTVHHAGA